MKATRRSNNFIDDDVSSVRTSEEMARFSLLLSEDYGEGPSSPPRSPAHKRLRHCSLFVSSDEEDAEAAEPEEEDQEDSQDEEDEDEEEEEEVDEFATDVLPAKTTGSVSDGSIATGSISVTLTDPDVLDCPICFDALSVPVFQCENGHIACSSCCVKIVNKCPSCAWPIGYNRCRAIEKVIECIKVSCRNVNYGCKDSIFYNKKTEHESACTYTPCSCPFRSCAFIGPSRKLYTHFSLGHRASAKDIIFNTSESISLKKNQKWVYLQEKIEDTIFIVNHRNEHLGSAVNIICVAPPSSPRRFPYDIVARKGKSSVKLQSVAENIPNWSEEMALKMFLLVPNDLLDSFGGLQLEVCIKFS